MTPKHSTLLLLLLALSMTVTAAPIWRRSVGNLQTFQGALGCPAPAITKDGSALPFKVIGPTGFPEGFLDIQSALKASCKIQCKLCHELAIKTLKFSAGDCKAQDQACLAGVSTTAPPGVPSTSAATQGNSTTTTGGTGTSNTTVTPTPVTSATPTPNTSAATQGGSGTNSTTTNGGKPRTGAATQGGSGTNSTTTTGSAKTTVTSTPVTSATPNPRTGAATQGGSGTNSTTTTGGSPRATGRPTSVTSATPKPRTGAATQGGSGTNSTTTSGGSPSSTVTPTSVTSATPTPNTAAATEATGGKGGVDPGTGETLLALPEANEFCKGTGQALGDGTQIKTGFCSSVGQGQVPAVEKMTSTVVLEPANGAELKVGDAINVKVKVQNMATGFFTVGDTEYYTQPQTLDAQGNVKGHIHVTVQNMGDGQTPPDANVKAFFKGLNDKAADDGTLSTEVPAGTIVEPGTYRICTITGSFSHQPIVMPVAQRGAQDDCIRVTVK